MQLNIYQIQFYCYISQGNLLLNKLIITIHNKDKIHSVTLNTVFSENRITDLVIV